MPNRTLAAAESATCGQPDKLCDLITDTILDHVLAEDQFARVDLDAMVTPGLVLLAGQLSTRSYIPLQAIIRKVTADVGYTGCDTAFMADSIAILNIIGEQSCEVAAVVDDKGAGNQCVCVGYATNEDREVGADWDYMPLAQWLAHQLTLELDRFRRGGEAHALFPDGGSQVIVEYEGDVPARVRSVTLAAHHRKDESVDDVRALLMNRVIEPVLAKLPAKLTADADRRANHAGPFTIGGPAADVGLSGRKGASDAYGTACAFGGSSPTGKDPTKTDRAALYMARYLAKNLVAAGIARRMEVRLVYRFGQRDPISVQVDSCGTSKAAGSDIAEALRKTLDLSSPGIVEHLNLRQVKYAPFACHGCFGRSDLDAPWERLDLVEALTKALA